MPKEILISRSAAETEDCGRLVAGVLPAGAVLALHGDLGSGKTTFARGFARGLGVDEPVTSPTFTIVQEYQAAGRRLYHLDMYRINGPADALAFGVEEFLFAADSVSLVEWPERIAALLLPGDERLFNLYFEHAGGDARRLVADESLAALLKAMPVTSG